MTTRRTFLQWFAIGSASSATSLLGCRGRSNKAKNDERPSLRARLLHLYLVVGPWPEAQRLEAERFYQDVLTDARVASYRDDDDLIGRLWTRFAHSPMAMDTLQLSDPEEWRVMNRIIDGAYLPGHYVNETRFVASGWPLPGQCMGAEWALPTPEGEP